MNAAFMIATIVLAFLFAAGSAAQESGPSTRPGELTRAQMESDLALLESAIREKWSYLEAREKNREVNLASLMTRAQSGLRDVMTKAEFHQVVLEFVAGLKDGHASVFTLGVPEPQRRWPFRVEETPEGFVVVETTKDGPELGARVLDVDGVAIEDAIAKLIRTTIASTDGARRRSAIKDLQESDSRSITVGLARADGTKRSVTFEPVDPEAAQSRLGGESAWSFDRVADGVARLRVRSFTIADWAAWRAAPVEKRDEILASTRAKIDACFKEIGTPGALILDLRGNGGGTDLLGIHLAKHLLSKRFVYTNLSAFIDGKWTGPSGIEYDPFPAAQRFDGPLAILIDERCFSVTDNFLRAIVENRDDVIVVGRPTNGGTGAPREIAKLPASETRVTLCTMRVYGPKGGLIEGRGTVPTIPVRWSAADFIEKRDPDLAAALQALKKAESRAGAQQTTATRPASRADVLDRAAMESDLALLEAAIREKWSYLEAREKNREVNLAALMTRARSSLRDVMTKAEFHQVVLELVAGLKDGHAAVFTLGVPQPQRRWPFRVEETPEGFVVVETTKDWVKPGERVLTVQHAESATRNIEDAIADLERTTIASTDGARRKAAIRRLQQTDSPILTVGLVRADGSKHGVSFEPVEPDAPQSKPAPTAEPVWSVDSVADGVARLRARSFTVDNWQAWLAAPVEKRDEFVAADRARIAACFKEIDTERALVLDLRGNPGGTDLLGIHLARHLLPKKFVYYGLSAKRDGKWPDPYREEHDPFPADQRFDGPLAILIDERCFSVTDNVLRAIVENRDDVIVVGRPTNGGTGAPRKIAELPASETSVTVCTMRVYGPKGELIEGRGTVPTIPVRWTAADFIEKRDPDLAAALQALRGVESRTPK